MTEFDYITLEHDAKTDYVSPKRDNVHRFPSKNSIDNPEKFWYLATVYSSHPGGKDAAYLDACRMQNLCQENGILVFCPIAHSHGAEKFMKEEVTYDFALGIDFKFLRMAKGLIVTKMTNWEISFGIRKEIELAKELGLPIIYTEFMEVPNVV